MPHHKPHAHPKAPSPAQTKPNAPLRKAKHTTPAFSPLCYGPGKVERAQAWATERGVDLGKSYFYSDSYSDAPMLRAVAYPRVISPDPRLSREARQRGWPVLQW